MPTQLLIHGSVLTLLTILALHLLFTAKYHYPLAPTNFLLLLAAVLLTMVSTIVVVVMTNNVLYARSRYWPFMFDYVEVTMPPSDWAPLALVGWFIMQGLVTFLAHATHIQFLTLLFPSSLERKLIIAFLGPLCVFASVMFFTHFLQDPNMQDLGDAIRNTATSTLSLLYTSGLLIWGFAVNRKRAWDSEGGTLGFGLISITLAFVSTAAEIIEVKEDRLRWLPWLVNTVLLWQSWAGFWWWVGAGMWSGEVADLEQREERQRRQQERRLKKRAKVLNMLVHKSNSVTASSTSPANRDSPQTSPISTSWVAPSGVASSRASIFSVRVRRRAAFNPLSSRHRNTQDGDIELSNLAQPSSPDHRGSRAGTDISSSLPSNDSGHQSGLLASLLKPEFLNRWLHRLSVAHNAAAKQQARTAGELKHTERVKRWGLRAMSERVITERLGTHLRPPPSAPRIPTEQSASQEEGEEEWISEGPEEEETSPVPGPSRLQGFANPPPQKESSPQRASRPRRLDKQPGRLDVNPFGSDSEGGMQHGHSWAWKGPLMKARLRDVTSYD